MFYHNKFLLSRYKTATTIVHYNSSINTCGGIINSMEKYSINNQTVSILLSWVQSGVVAIPEIQRPFVWSKTQVRNLIDSLYQGYPVGYIITWQNPHVRLKDGTTSQGKHVLIDGQQRITALRAAILGLPVMNKKYKFETIAISFNPITEEFKVKDKSTERGAEWIPDIFEAMRDDLNQLSLLERFMEKNPHADRNQVLERILRLIQIKNKNIGNIVLSADLPIEIVNEIFIRINASGVNLSNADFAMSKIAVYENELGDEFGMNLRKFIDYFCNLAIEPTHFKDIEANDTMFVGTDYFKHISWLRADNDDIYDPDYNDILRVAALTEFNRGRLSDLVALLSGRNFETRENLKEIADESFKKLETGVYKFTREYHMKHFVQDILRASGFKDAAMLGSKNAINYAYAVYLRARDIGEETAVTNKYIRRLLVLSLLTGRHSGSFETLFEHDIKLIRERGDIERLVRTIEEQTMSDIYWSSTLPDDFDKTNTSNPFWNIFTAAQNKLGKSSFLSDSNKVESMTTAQVHHVFPKNYLVKHGIERSDYNKIANFVYLRDDINIKVSDLEPKQYMAKVTQYSGSFGSDVSSDDLLAKNLKDSALPELLCEATYEDFFDFMVERRKLMALIVKEYYETL